MALLAVGLGLYGLLFVRALRTFRLTQRSTDLLVAVGIVWLCAALAPALVFDYTNLGWWLGYGFELVGITLVGGAVAFDLYRGSGMSRALVGDLRAIELVTQEEAFLGLTRSSAARLTRGKGRLDRGAHAASRSPRRRGRRGAGARPPRPARARARRPAARHGQALGAG